MGSWTIADNRAGDAKGLQLLFAAGKRPNRAAINEFTSGHRSLTLTHDPSDDVPIHLVADGGEKVTAGRGAASGVEDRNWVEFLHDGLTFDLVGLAPGQSCPISPIGHQFDLEGSPSAQRMEALKLMPGQHLAGGANALPVVRALVALGRDLIHHFDDLLAVIWEPADSAIGRRFFESVTTAWLDGGPFPALGLTAFRETMDGALQSVGLDYWIGQELRIEPPLSNDKVEATRLAIRLVNHLVIIGGIEDSERIIAPDGNQILMRLSRNRRFIRVSRE